VASSTVKRVVVYRFDRQPLEGVINPSAYLLDNHLELITLQGNLQMVPYVEIKAVCFVSEAGEADLFTEHNLFERRPKVPGLWTRFTFRDGDRLDGILSHNLLDWPERGYSITPAGSGAKRQRVFVPRTAVVSTELRGVVGGSLMGLAQREKKGAVSAGGQLSMFDS